MAATLAVTVVKTSDGSSYTGLTSAFVDGQRFLYAANFTKGRVDVYDNAFHLVDLSKQHFDEDSADQEDRHSAENSFADEKLPRSYVPFNVQAIGNDIVVTYVLREEGSGFEAGGPGLGFVDIYSSTGRLLRRLEHGDWLNAPWGVALAPLDFGRFSHDLLMGQFAHSVERLHRCIRSSYWKVRWPAAGRQREATRHQRHLGAQPWQRQPSQ